DMRDPGIAAESLRIGHEHDGVPVGRDLHRARGDGARDELAAGRAHDGGPPEADTHAVRPGRDRESLRVEDLAKFRGLRPGHDAHRRLPRILGKDPLVYAPVPGKEALRRDRTDDISVAQRTSLEPAECPRQERPPAAHDRLYVESPAYR